MRLPIEEIQQKLGYTFTDATLLATAFTHVSYAKTHGGKDNERLEYLGDAVLGMLIAKWQYAQPTLLSEGEMTSQRKTLVCEEALLQKIKEMDVCRYLLFEGGQANVGAKTYASLYECIIGAIYLDGGETQAEQFLFRHFPAAKMECNYKGELQEYLQSQGKPIPEYKHTKRGKDNAPTFVSEVSFQGKKGVGEGASKRLAEQNAAKALLETLKG